MSNLFVLDIKTHPTTNQVTLRLRNQQGQHLATQSAKIPNELAFEWVELFKTCEQVKRYANRLVPAQQHTLSETELIAQLGVFLGREVLGEAICQHLYAGTEPRTLLIQLPASEEEPLAAALARIPWEIARPALEQAPLLARQVVIRAMIGPELPDVQERSLTFGPNEVLRVLLIFAETEDSNPLAARLEREQLLALFYEQILPQRLVQIDSLCYGVTRATLAEQVRKAKGYHIVHWSGHGCQDRLVLSGEPDQQISGAGLVELFQQAGGLVPKLMFLSANQDLTGFGNLSGPNREGYSSTALALLKAGVPQVIAMRYSITDAYARPLTLLFYQQLLAEQHSVEAALALARSQWVTDPNLGAIEQTAPLLFGQNRWRLVAAQQPNGVQLKQRYPDQRFQPLLADDKYGFKARPHFVGRRRELTRLSQAWLSETPESPVALLQGLAGLGKTALAAEVVNLWHSRFDWVLVIQSRGYALNAEAFYQQLDLLLVRLNQAYRQDCQQNEHCKLWLPKDEPERYQTMRENVLAVLHKYPILLILDNFETNLLAKCDGYVCQDPEWTALLTALVTRLQGKSRVMITSRHRPVVLDQAVWLALGPLPDQEAELFLFSQPAFNQLSHPHDRVAQLFKISHGHPLLMQLLGNLAQDQKELAAALALLTEKGLTPLPEWVGDAQQESGYLEEVALGAMDVLLARLCLEGQQLLWVVTRALEPVPYPILSAVWQNTVDKVIDIGPLLNKLTESGLLQQEGRFEKSVFSFHELVRERCTAWVAQYPPDCWELDAKQIGQAYGEQYARLFEELLSSDKETATEMGRRAVTYLVRAEAFNALGGVASTLVNSTRNPQQLQAIIAELATAVEQAPTEQTRWRMRGILAEALKRAGQPQLALPLFAQSVSEAEAAQSWADVAVTSHNWAGALLMLGQPLAAREALHHSSQASRQAGRPAIHILMTENEALRIDIQLGQVETVLPTIEQNLAQIRDWWQRHQQGETISSVPNADLLARAFISTLDIAQSAHRALKHWQDCLELLTETESVQKASGESEQALSITRFNRYPALLEFGRLKEAQQVLENCLQVQTHVGDVTEQARILSALAEVWEAHGDVSRAIELTRQSLAIRERLPNPEVRAISHHNLSNYSFSYK